MTESFSSSKPSASKVESNSMSSFLERIRAKEQTRKELDKKLEDEITSNSQTKEFDLAFSTAGQIKSIFTYSGKATLPMAVVVSQLENKQIQGFRDKADIRQMVSTLAKVVPKWLVLK